MTGERIGGPGHPAGHRWRLSWLATRVDRANTRAERTWAALDAALVRRAQGAAEMALAPAWIRRRPCWCPTRRPAPSPTWPGGPGAGRKRPQPRA